MGKIIETDEFTADIYQIEITDDVIGGEDGISNKAAKALANRTLYLKNQVAAKAATSGSSLQRFKVSVALNPDEAVNKEQMEEAMSNLDISSITGFKNLIINGCKRVNQRGATAIDETASAYNFDRWYYDGTNFIQYIEDKNIVLSGTYTLSWVGTATATVDGVDVPNGGQVTLTANTQCEVKFNSSNFNFVQLEYGSKKTNFETMPYQLQLFLCQRYYYDISLNYFVLSVYYISPSYARNFLIFPIEMRTTPSMSKSGIFLTSSGFCEPTLDLATSKGVRLSNPIGNSSNYTVWVTGGKIHADAEIYPI